MLNTKQKKFMEILKASMSLTNEQDKIVFEALEKFQDHPVLCRRLLTLKEEGVRLTYVNENPWRDKMLVVGIRVSDIEIVSQYLDFLDHENDARIIANMKNVNRYFKFLRRREQYAEFCRI